MELSMRNQPFTGEKRRRQRRKLIRRELIRLEGSLRRSVKDRRSDSQDIWSDRDIWKDQDS